MSEVSDEEAGSTDELENFDDLFADDEEVGDLFASNPVPNRKKRKKIS